MEARLSSTSEPEVLLSGDRGLEPRVGTEGWSPGRGGRAWGRGTAAVGAGGGRPPYVRRAGGSVLRLPPLDN